VKDETFISGAASKGWESDAHGIKRLHFRPGKRDILLEEGKKEMCLKKGRVTERRVHLFMRGRVHTTNLEHTNGYRLERKWQYIAYQSTDEGLDAST